jgi:hypothetical protein
MLIHAHRRRSKCTHEIGGKRYVFLPNQNDDVVCDVKEQAAIDRFLELDEAFCEYIDPDSPQKQVAAKTAARQRKTGASADGKSSFVISNGATKIDLAAMDDAALLAFASGQELDVEASLTGDALRAAIRDGLLGTE